ncbi:MAG: hypothetical protein IJQ73_02160, partial [Kiritimatiellae bacterium]|nr:hypothetical protein [Kiritimatiellia bacterium]
LAMLASLFVHKKAYRWRLTFSTFQPFNLSTRVNQLARMLRWKLDCAVHEGGAGLVFTKSGPTAWRQP